MLLPLFDQIRVKVMGSFMFMVREAMLQTQLLYTDLTAPKALTSYNFVYSLCSIYEIKPDYRNEDSRVYRRACVAGRVSSPDSGYVLIVFYLSRTCCCFNCVA